MSRPAIRRGGVAAPLILLALGGAARAQPSADGASEIVPVVVAGRVELTAPTVVLPAIQGVFDARMSLAGATVRARSVEPFDGVTLEAAGSTLTGVTIGGGSPPSSTGADYQLAVPSYGAEFLLSGELRLGDAGEDHYQLGPIATGCTTHCKIDKPSNLDLGCSAACTFCPAGCDPPAAQANLDLVEEVAFIELRFSALCADLEINPTHAFVEAWVDDGDGVLDRSLDTLRSWTDLTNKDTTPEAAAAPGDPRTAVRFPVPAGAPLLIAGDLRFGTAHRRVLIVTDPRAAGTLVLQPGELLAITDPTPVSAAQIPPTATLPTPTPKDCDPPTVGLMTASFDLREDVCDSIDELMSFSTAALAGPSLGQLALVSPTSIPKPGLKRTSGPFLDRYELSDLLLNTRARTLPDHDGDYYVTAPYRFTLNRANGKRAYVRGTAPGLEAASSLLANDPIIDLDTDCGFDPIDPIVAAIQALAPLVDAYNDAPIEGLETLNGSSDYRSCPTEAALPGEVAMYEAYRDGLRVRRDPPSNELMLPSFVTEFRSGVHKGVIRLLDGVIDDRGDVTELAAETTIDRSGLRSGETDPSLVLLRGSDQAFETSFGTSTDTVPLELRLDRPTSGRDPLRLPSGTPTDADGVRAFFGTPSLFDLGSLSDAEILAFPFMVPPDLSVPENRDAFERSETLLHYGAPAALGANVPAPVATRTLRLRFDHKDRDVHGAFALIDVTKPVTHGARLRGSDLQGPMPTTFPGPDLPSIAFPLTLDRDLVDGRRDGAPVSIPAGTVIDTAIDGSEHLLDPAISDGSFRFGDAWNNDSFDATVDTEPTPDPNPDDNDATLDRVSARAPRLMKPDEPPATRSRLLDRTLLEPEELSLENFGVCLGTVRIVLKAAKGSHLVDPIIRGRGFLNSALLPDDDGDGLPDPISTIRPDLAVDLNEDGVDDQYLVVLDDTGLGFTGRPTSAAGFGRNGSVTLILPAGDYVLEPAATVRADGDPDSVTFTELTPIELTVPCGGELTVNAGEPACPLTQGFWKRQCKGPHPSGEHSNLPTYVSYVNAFATFSSVADENDICDRLHPDPPSDKCEQAEAQFMATLLNLASGRVPEDAVATPSSTSAATALEVAEAIDDILSDPARTFEDCVEAQSLAASFNEGDSLPASADCPGETAPPSLLNSYRIVKRPSSRLLHSWRNLPRGKARKYEVCGFAAALGAEPSGRVLDMVGECLDAGLDGTAGFELASPPSRLHFYRARGLSPTFEYPGSLGP